MVAQGPERTTHYKSLVSDSDFWSRFPLRPDDVFICTPPKSGTTWMQTICGLLILGDAKADPGVGTVSRWIDSAFNDEAELLPTMAAQEHRRYLKTHTPLDGITYDARCTYLTVHRHPIDVLFSAQNHLKNMTSDWMDHLIVEDIEAGFAEFTDTPFSPEQEIDFTLESLVRHYRSFAGWRHLPNIHMFHYADMTRDLRGAVARVAAILGVEDAGLIEAVTEAARFSSMKRKADTYAPSADRGIWKDNANFFESGSSNKWIGILGDESLARYEARMKDLLPPEDVAWLEHGRAAP